MDQSDRTYPDYQTLEERQQTLKAPQFIVNGGGQWDETTSRIHCVEVIYRDPYYIERRIKKWALTVEEAYQSARDAWLAEREAGRAL